MRAKPCSDLVGAQRRRQIGGAQHGAVGQMSRDTRRAILDECLADRAPHAIGGHQHVAFHAVGGANGQRDGACGVREIRDRLVQIHVNALVAHGRTGQRAVQIRPVHGDIGRAVAFDRARAQRQLAQHLAGQRAAGLQLIRKGGDHLQLVAQAPVAQDAGDVRPQLNARAHLAERGGAFVQANFTTGPRAAQRRGQATNPAPCDQHLQCAHDPRLCRDAVRALHRAAEHDPRSAQAAPADALKVTSDGATRIGRRGRKDVLGANRRGGIRAAGVQRLTLSNRSQRSQTNSCQRPTSLRWRPVGFKTGAFHRCAAPARRCTATGAAYASSWRST